MDWSEGSLEEGGERYGSPGKNTALAAYHHVNGDQFTAAALELVSEWLRIVYPTIRLGPHCSCVIYQSARQGPGQQYRLPSRIVERAALLQDSIYRGDSAN